MRKVNIRELRGSLAKELLDLPFEVTRRGVVVAVVDYPVQIVSTMSNPEGGIMKPPTYFNPMPKKK